GLHGVRIREALLSSRSRVGSAYVSGIGPSAQIVVTDTLVGGATAAELRFAIARQLGHLRNGDPLHRTLLQALILVFGAALAVFIADRVGFRRDDDPVSRLALVGALLGCVYVVALPIYNAYSRSLEVRADRYAATLSGNPQAGVRMSIRQADQDLLAVCPNRFSLWYFDAFPPTAERVSALQNRSNPCP
ncbi:MAG: M48 family metalloprotease, partial [Candidatus Eremiobacteraeota bacterium]|nr:M48 family metalloprotease [Candidatus Eremiobacteraeota bacterium]